MFKGVVALTSPTDGWGVTPMRGVSRHAFDAGLALQHITRGTGEMDGGPCWVEPLLRAVGTVLRGAEAMAWLELFHCKAGRSNEGVRFFSY